MSLSPMALSGCSPCCSIVEVRPLPSSEPRLSTPATMTASQTPIVRHGWAALARARRSVKPHGPSEW